MHYNGPIYRPPTEQNASMLQVTVGCSYNKCAFCTMYKSAKFHMSPESEIIEDLQELAALKHPIRRLFLLNGDPFVLSADKLLRIAELVHQYLPSVETMTCYCSVRDLKNKTLDELKALRKAGYNDLYIGLESGYAPAIELLQKGYTLPEAERILSDLVEAGFNYNALIMNGAAGKGNSEPSVAATAKLLNTYKPKIVSLLSTSVFPNTPLAELRDRGEYVELTERDQIQEELMLLNALNMEDTCYFFGSHPFNAIPYSNYFSEKQKIIEYIESELAEYDDDFLDSVWQRDSI